MAIKNSIFGLVSLIIILMTALRTSNAQNGWKSSAGYISAATEGSTLYIKPDKTDATVWIYRIPPDTIFVDYDQPKSCPIVIMDVPVTAKYNVCIEVGYGDSSQHKEEYRLEINNSISDIIPDTVKVDTPPLSHYYLTIDHGVHTLYQGNNSIVFHKGNQTPADSANSVHFRAIKIIRLPSMLPEPSYTQGTSNSICWISAIAKYQDPHCFEVSSGAACNCPQLLYRSTELDTSCHTYEGLRDGTLYGYFVEAYFDNKSMRSDTVFSTQDNSSPTQVKIDDLYAFNNKFVTITWHSACDALSGVAYYQILRSDFANCDTIATISDNSFCDTTNIYTYIDSLPDTKREYSYRIDAIDAVGNRRSGKETSRVVQLCRPEIQILPPLYCDDSTCYAKGTEITICANVSNDCIGIHKPDAVRFQAVKDNVHFFDYFGSDFSKLLPDGVLMDSSWKFIDDVASISFKLGDMAFVNGHKYFYRAQFKDKFGNYSEWSDTLSAIQDCYPPSDISDLEATMNADSINGWIDIKWQAAEDYGSGVKGYQIHRQINGMDTTIQECYADITYKDTSIDVNKIVCYWISSVDNVGNKQEASNSKACVRFQAPPVIVTLISENVLEGKKYTTKDFTLLFLNLNAFEKQDLSCLIVDINGSQQEREISNTQVLLCQK